ncbi:MAG: multidrug transporter [Anaerolineae bacterium]|nr:multidrug transporter [Anaerolineae bacterium]
MKKIIIRDENLILPFNEPARELRIMNKPLWLYQRDVLSPYCQEELECKSFAQISSFSPKLLAGELVIYRDNLFFDEFLFEAFITKARRSGQPAQIAFAPDDAAIVNHALLNLQTGIRLAGNVYVADLFYYPDGAVLPAQKPQPLVIDTQPREIGYYRVPNYIDEQGDLVYQVPLRAFLSIENWIHIFIANGPFGIFAHGARIENLLEWDWSPQNISMYLKVLWRSLLERKQFLSSSALVSIGKNTQIDPTAVIQGPTIIGDNVVINPGAVIFNSVIGDNVTVMPGAELLLSVVGNGSYLAFRSALFLTTLMENSMVAQNSCLQVSIIGRNTFIGAGNTFTDWNMLPDKPIRVFHRGELREVGLPIVGGCVGHNCRIGSGHVFFPARSIDSDVVLVAKQGRTVITENINYEDSDHHQFSNWGGHEVKYHDDAPFKAENQIEAPLASESDSVPVDPVVESTGYVPPTHSRHDPDWS